MTEEQCSVIADLRNEGYAVALFSPEELAGVDANSVQNMMVEAGQDAITTLK